MPIIPSLYNPPLLFKNGHFSTIYSGLFRKVLGVNQQRERILLPDGDFLDLDWSYSKSQTNKVAIIVHGLEGNAQELIYWGVQNYLIYLIMIAALLIYEAAVAKPTLYSVLTTLVLLKI